MRTPFCVPPLRLDFFADTFFAKSILVATFDEVTDEMFVPGWNLYCQTLKSNNRGMGKKMRERQFERTGFMLRLDFFCPHIFLPGRSLSQHLIR